MSPSPSDRAELAAGTRWLTLATVAVGGLNYAFALVLTRLLDPGSFSTYGAGQALLLAVGTVATSSVPWVLAQALTVATDAEERRRAVAFALGLNVVLGLLAALATGALAWHLGGPGVAAAVAGSSVLILLSSTPAGWLQGKRRFGQAAALRLVDVVVKVAVGLGLVLGGAGATGALVGFAAGSAVVLTTGLVLCREDLGRASGVLRARALWTNAGGIGAVQGLVSVVAAMDVVLVASLDLPDTSSGSYQAATVLARVPLFFGGAVAIAAFPLLATAERPGSVIALSYRLFAILAVPYSLALATMPTALLERLFPPEYSEVGRLLPVLALSGLALGLLNVVTTFFQSLGAYRLAIGLQLAGLALTATSLGVGAALGDDRGVAVGAAVGGVLTVGLLVVAGARRWQRPLRPAALVRPAAAALVIAGLLLALRPVLWAWLPVAALVGAASLYEFVRGERSA